MFEKRLKTLRTLETHAQYERHMASEFHPKSCYLCSAKPLKAYQHWKIIENQFPYDEVATMHNMVVSLRHTSEHGLTPEEVTEYKKVKMDLHEEYDMIVENTRMQKSIPGHHHLHLLKLKERLIRFEENRPEAGFLSSAHIGTQSGP